jgi:hypothetical protein
MRQLMLRHRYLSAKCIWTRTNLVSSRTDFNSPGEHKRFCDYIEKQVLSGCAIERVADPGYEKGLLSGGRWFEDRDTKEIWRLVPPDFPLRGPWEKADLSSS